MSDAAPTDGLPGRLGDWADSNPHLSAADRALVREAVGRLRSYEVEHYMHGVCNAFRPYHAETPPFGPDAMCARCSRPFRFHTPKEGQS